VDPDVSLVSGCLMGRSSILSLTYAYRPIFFCTVGTNRDRPAYPRTMNGFPWPSAPLWRARSFANASLGVNCNAPFWNTAATRWFTDATPVYFSSLVPNLAHKKKKTLKTNLVCWSSSIHSLKPWTNGLGLFASWTLCTSWSRSIFCWTKWS
jgi:hypothetical protein